MRCVSRRGTVLALSAVLSAVLSAACGAFGEERSSTNDDPSAGVTAIRALGVPESITLDFEAANDAPALGMAERCFVPILDERRPTVRAVVANETGAPAVLSAWGACSTGHDVVYLAFYRGERPPETDLEMSRCEGRPAVGHEGPSSEESAGSGYCKALLAKDGHGLSMAPGERAVVVFQHQPFAFDADNRSTAPVVARVQLD